MNEPYQIALLKACRIVGGQKQLSEKLNVLPSRLNKWINQERKRRRMPIPYWYALEIEKITQGEVNCYHLIPDWDKIIEHSHQHYSDPKYLSSKDSHFLISTEENES